MGSTEDIDAVKEGVDHIFKFMIFLNVRDVKAIPADNEPFNMD